jgi:aminomethyltransferase
VHQELGARLVPFAGYEMPVQYTSIIEEHRAVRTSAGIFDLSHMGEIEVRGESAVDFVSHAVVSDPATLDIGQAGYSMLCDADGGIIDDVIIYRLDDDRVWIVCNAGNRAAVLGQLTALHAQGAVGAQLEDISERTALVAPQGPDAAGLLAGLTDVDIDGIANYHATPGRVAGVDCLIARTGYTGEDGFELFCAAVEAVRLWRALAGAGAPHEARPCGLGARDTLRLEAGMPLYGNELDRTTNPYEVNLGRIVKLDKGEFVGRSALEAIKEAGPERKLIGLQMLDNAIPRAGYEVRAGGRTVGRITSGTLSPTLGTKIAMATVPATLAGIGNAFEVVVRDRPYRAEQVKLPFYRRPRD